MCVCVCVCVCVYACVFACCMCAFVCLQAQNLSQLEAWLTHLEQHQLYLQNQLSSIGLDPRVTASMVVPNKAAKGGGRPEYMRDRMESLAKMEEGVTNFNSRSGVTSLSQ